MNYNEVESILSNILERETEVLDKPTDKEWKELSNKFNCSFINEFKYFIELMTFWSFPGDIYNISKGKTNGNDTLEEVYNYEMSNGIGNGDYFCLHRLESKVYYYYDDKGKFEEYCDSFKAWIEDLPNFLA